MLKLFTLKFSKLNFNSYVECIDIFDAFRMIQWRLRSELKLLESLHTQKIVFTLTLNHTDKTEADLFYLN